VKILIYGACVIGSIFAGKNEYDSLYFNAGGMEDCAMASTTFRFLTQNCPLHLALQQGLTK